MLTITDSVFLAVFMNSYVTNSRLTVFLGVFVNSMLKIADSVFLGLFMNTYTEISRLRLPGLIHE